MLSLHPQDFKSNPCHLPYRSLVAPSIPPETSYFPHFTMGSLQHPPTAHHQEQRLGLETPVSPRSRSPTVNDSSACPSSYYESAAAPTTLSPPADYSNLDPNTVAEALEIARDSPDGARDPVVSGILESALSQIWDRVMASPEGYVMTTGEFAVFNFYQHRFMGNKVAIAARRRFWDNTHA